METFHFTPKQISEITVKKMQEIMLIKRVRGEALEIKSKLDKVKSQSSSTRMPKRGRKGYREI